MLKATYCFIFFIGLMSVSARAETLHITVLDQTGNAVPDTAVYTLPSGAPPVAASTRSDVIIDQIDKEFVHPVTVIRPGMSVIFPNHDKIRHHVYSFSPSKTFELPLYKDETPQPIRFDKPGVVALGCNIHDWMSAYIYVVDSPFIALTDAQGQADLSVPAGRYELHAWHPRLKNPNDNESRNVTVQAKQNADIKFVVALKKSFKSIARITTGGFEEGAYR